MHMIFARKTSIASSPVLAVDALGLTAKIIVAGEDDLMRLGNMLEQQYYRFRAKVPHRFMFVGRKRIWRSTEFQTFRLNDMFVLYSDKGGPENSFKHLVASSLLYQMLLVEGFIPRGGLGVGALLRANDLLVGKGFVDAYAVSEKREESTRHICAIQLSADFLKSIPNTEKAFRLLCCYKNAFFLHPWYLTDPELGQFTADRIVRCLRESGANDQKLAATTDFLCNLQDYDAANSAGPR
jgi:hypothetical protein